MIDDFLPFDSHNQLLFASNKSGENSIWAALLEKALAKVLGSYSCLSKIKIIDMLLHLSGGLLETYDLYSVKNYVKYKRNDSSDEASDKSNDFNTLWNILMVSNLKDSTVFCLSQVSKLLKIYCGKFIVKTNNYFKGSK